MNIIIHRRKILLPVESVKRWKYYKMTYLTKER